MKKRIDFLIVGAQKAGTSSLYTYLAQLPTVYVPAVQDVHFFLREEFYRKGERYLDRFYGDAPAGRVWGGAQAQLMYFEDCVARIKAHNPGMKIVAVLRNPIDRAYSAYWFARYRKTETAETFEEALAREPQRLRGTFQERAEFAYLAHGHYAGQLQPFRAAFGAEKVHCVLSDLLGKDPAAVVADVAAWLGASAPDEGISYARANESGMARVGWIPWLLNQDRLSALARRLTPDALRLNLRKYVLDPLLRANTRPFRYPPMRPETRARLVEYFRPHNEALAELLGRALPGWDS